MISKNKEDNRKATPSNLLPNKSNISQKIIENQLKSFSSSNIPRLKIQSFKNRKMKKLNQKCKNCEFFDFSSANIVRNYSCKSVSKGTKFSLLPSVNKNSNYISIKTVAHYIKQKILDMSMKLEKDDSNFSEIENGNNCNITMPLISTNKIIKK